MKDKYGDGLVEDDRSPRAKIVKAGGISTHYGTNGIDRNREPFSEEEAKRADRIGTPAQKRAEPPRT